MGISNDSVLRSCGGQPASMAIAWVWQMRSPLLRRSTGEFVVKPLSESAFSAPAEVNRSLFFAWWSCCRVLRSCGGQPILLQCLIIVFMRSPLLRRSTAHRLELLVVMSAFSAPAEVNRNTGNFGVQYGGVLRSCGGQPRIWFFGCLIF